jgi:hypothetical protein
MYKLKRTILLVLCLTFGARALDTTITYTGGRLFGAFKLDGRSNTSTSARTDVPDTVRFGTGLALTRLVNKGEFCTLACSYAVQTGILFQVDSGSAGVRNSLDSNWNEALSFPAQLSALDSINPLTLSPCFGGGPYGLGFLVSDDYTTSVWSGCGNVSTFRVLNGYNRIVYYRKGGVFMKVQVAGFESSSASCEFVNPPMTCLRGDKILFRYVITDDSTGYFGTDPISLRGRESMARAPKPTGLKAWKSDLFRMILGRSSVSSDGR